MRTSESIKEIAPALLKAQKEINAVAKKGKADTGKFKYEYAELPDVIEACKNQLNENGIVVLQPVAGDMVQTRLQHVSGEWMEDEGTRIVCSVENDPQKYGAALTYARRYSLLSNLFMPTSDDDAQSAMPKPKPAPMPDKIVETDTTDPLCSLCGTRLVHVSGTKKDGKPYAGWKCPKSTVDNKHPFIFDKQ